jgi:hypothetical protein
MASRSWSSGGKSTFVVGGDHGPPKIFVKSAILFEIFQVLLKPRHRIKGWTIAAAKESVNRIGT